MMLPLSSASQFCHIIERCGSTLFLSETVDMMWNLKTYQVHSAVSYRMQRNKAILTCQNDRNSPHSEKCDQKTFERYYDMCSARKSKH